MSTADRPFNCETADLKKTEEDCRRLQAIAGVARFPIYGINQTILV